MGLGTLPTALCSAVPREGLLYNRSVTIEEPGAAWSPPNRGRLQTLAPIAIFDVIGPLVVYYSLRSAGFSTVTALVLSGVLPAFGIALKVARHRTVDAVGILVLIGIAVGTALGLASGNAHLVLLDGTVPTAVFGAVCLGSLGSKRPLMFRFALETMERTRRADVSSPISGDIRASVTRLG